MSKHNYGVQLSPKNSYKTLIKFNSLEDREQFLSLLNKAKVNSPITLFEEIQEGPINE